MIKTEMMFNKDVLNIFTDASIDSEKSIGCAGAHVVTGYTATDNILEQPRILIENTTNNNSEIRAILLGAQCALKYRKYFKCINIISDSKICVYGLKQWIFNWVKNTNPGQPLISSQGTEVANQDIIMQVIYTILNNNLCINLYHQSGHVNINNKKSLEEAKSIFISSNGLLHDVEFDLIKNISVANNIVDSFTRSHLSDYNRNLNYPKDLLKFFYSPFDIERYSKLINGGR